MKKEIDTNITKISISLSNIIVTSDDKCKMVINYSVNCWFCIIDNTNLQGFCAWEVTVLS